MHIIVRSRFLRQPPFSIVLVSYINGGFRKRIRVEAYKMAHDAKLQTSYV